MKLVGITGGIGSGKSIVSQVIEAIGYPVYNSDNRAKELMNENREVREAITSLFGSAAYVDNQLNRSYIAQEIFNHETKRLKMNQVVHPAVRADFLNWAQQSHSDLVFQESALLFETGSYVNFDHVILVVAPEQVRINRVMKRDGVTEAEVKARLAAQLPDSEKRKHTPWVIDNSGEQMVLPQILNLIQCLKETT